MSATIRGNWVTESVHVYTFEVSDDSGEFSREMETAAASETEAKKHIRERLERCGVTRSMKLISVRFNVYKRTKTIRVAS